MSSSPRYHATLSMYYMVDVRATCHLLAGATVMWSVLFKSRKHTENKEKVAVDNPMTAIHQIIAQMVLAKGKCLQVRMEVNYGQARASPKSKNILFSQRKVLTANLDQ